jgi:hypothetical protein
VLNSLESPVRDASTLVWLVMGILEHSACVHKVSVIQLQLSFVETKTIISQALSTRVCDTLLDRICMYMRECCSRFGEVCRDTAPVLVHTASLVRELGQQAGTFLEVRKTR